MVGRLGGLSLPPAGVAGKGPPPLWVWLGLGEKRHDLSSSPPSCACGLVGGSQIEELRRPLNFFNGMGMRKDI